MVLNVLGAIHIWVQAMAVVLFIVCAALIILVLLQKGRGSGLSAAFGGAGGQSAFGSKTGDIFTWATIVVVIVYFLLAMVMTKYYKPYFESDKPSDQLTASTASAPVAPAPAGSTHNAPATPSEAPSAPAAAPVTSTPGEQPKDK